jgi:antitoxin MazE
VNVPTVPELDQLGSAVLAWFTMRARLQRIGNAQGVVIPNSVLSQVGFAHDVEIDVHGETVVISKPKRHPREGWDAASRAITAAGNDRLVWPEFANTDDAKLKW